MCTGLKRRKWREIGEGNYSDRVRVNTSCIKKRKPELGTCPTIDGKNLVKVFSSVIETGLSIAKSPPSFPTSLTLVLVALRLYEAPYDFKKIRPIAGDRSRVIRRNYTFAEDDRRALPGLAKPMKLCSVRAAKETPRNQ